MKKALLSILFTFTLILLNSCTLLQDSLHSIVISDTSIAFEINDLSAVGQTKNISVGGKASLPDDTQLTVSAIRLLSNSPENDDFDGETIYAILDRQFAMVKNRQWQANLELQEKDANGSSLESWQLALNSSKDDINPSSSVIFTVSLEPSAFTEKLQEILSNSTINNGNTQISYTAEGEPYLRVSRMAAIEIPSDLVGRPINYREAWEARSDYKPSIEESRNPAELPFYETDNLPLPVSNMLQ
jgi:hypothetical protein